MTRLWDRICINSLRPSVAPYTVINVPLPKPILINCQLDHWEEISLDFELRYINFRSWKWNLEMSTAKYQPFCSGLNVLKGTGQVASNHVRYIIWFQTHTQKMIYSRWFMRVKLLQNYGGQETRTITVKQVARLTLRWKGFDQIDASFWTSVSSGVFSFAM